MFLYIELAPGWHSRSVHITFWRTCLTASSGYDPGVLNQQKPKVGGSFSGLKPRTGAGFRGHCDCEALANAARSFFEQRQHTAIACKLLHVYVFPCEPVVPIRIPSFGNDVMLARGQSE